MAAMESLWQQAASLPSLLWQHSIAWPSFAAQQSGLSADRPPLQQAPQDFALSWVAVAAGGFTGFCWLWAACWAKTGKYAATANATAKAKVRTFISSPQI
jgi:hypothetical protein